MSEKGPAPQAKFTNHDLEDQVEVESHVLKYYPEIYNSVPYLVVFDFLFRPWAYLCASKNSAVRYVISGCSFYGGLIFLVGAFAGSSATLVNNYSGKGFNNVYPWLVTVGYFIGTYVFTLGCFLLTVESLNLQFDEEMSNWKSGNRATKPTFRYFAFAPRNIGWWAGVSYLVGALMYNVGSTSFLANTFQSVNFTPDMAQYLGLLPYLTGGPLFLTSGFLYLVQFSGNPLRGMFIPLNKSDMTSVTWWVNWFNWWGGAGFCMSGFWEYWYQDYSVLMYRIQNDIGFGIGGLFFSAGGFLLYAQTSVAKCKIGKAPGVSVVSVRIDSEGGGEESVLNSKLQAQTPDVLGWANYNNAPQAPSMVA